jgi:hypothetical protein
MNGSYRGLPWKGKNYWNLGTNFIILGVIQKFIRTSKDLN